MFHDTNDGKISKNAKCIFSFNVLINFFDCRTYSLALISINFIACMIISKLAQGFIVSLKDLKILL
jgi:hypothetical protein